VKNTRAYKLNVVEGEHAGHNVVVDAFGVDFFGRDPKTAAYCHDCRESLEVYDVKDGEELGEKSNAND
jgi:hypothetical protein